jgi:RNA polymerase sigma factor (sigma-70 family)
MMTGARDSSSFVLLFSKARQSAEAYTRKLCPTVADAEDLMQNAVVVAWRYFPRLRDENQFKWLLFEIIKQQHINLVRTRVRRLPSGGEPSRATNDPRGWEQSIHTEIESELDLREALAQVELSTREAVLLTWAGFSQYELCALYGCTRSCMNMRIVRGREAIRRYMREGRKRGREGNGCVEDILAEIARLVEWANVKLWSRNGAEEMMCERGVELSVNN